MSQQINPHLLKQKMEAFQKASREMSSKSRVVSDGIVTIKTNPGILHSPNASEQEKLEANCTVIHFENLEKAWDQMDIDTNDLSNADIMRIKIQYVMRSYDTLNIKLQTQMADDVIKLKKQLGLDKLA
jgi:hypothetical protein